MKKKYMASLIGGTLALLQLLPAPIVQSVSAQEELFASSPEANSSMPAGDNSVTAAADVTSDPGTPAAQEEQTPAAGESDTAADTQTQSVVLPSVVNFRDLGGLVGYLDCPVKPATLLRSGDLTHISEEDLNKLTQDMNLSMIIDLRDPLEITKSPDPPITGVYNYRLEEILGSNSGAGMTVLAPADEDASFPMQMVYAADEKGVGVSEWLQERYTSDYLLGEQAIREYQLMFQLLKRAEGSVLIHSSLGKDRTGVASFLILAALGVNIDTIRTDYASSEAALQEKLAQSLEEVPDSGMQEKLTAAYSAQTAWLDGAADVLGRDYGSVEGYLRTAIGLTDDDFAALRGRYLEMRMDPGTVAGGEEQLAQATQEYLANAYVAEYETFTDYAYYDDTYGYGTDEYWYGDGGYTDYTDYSDGGYYTDYSDGGYYTDYTDDTDYTDYSDYTGYTGGEEQYGGDAGGETDPSAYGELN